MERPFILGLSWILLPLVVFIGVLHKTQAELTMEAPLGVTENFELVVEKGGEFMLTCIGDSPISWNYSYYEPQDGSNRSVVDIRKNLEHGMYRSTLKLRDAYYLDTGNFSCFPSSEGKHSPWAKAIYVYVKDPEHPLATVDTFEIIMMTTSLNDKVIFPCRPTDPELDVVLMKDDEVVPDTTYDPHIGFTFVAESVHQSGYYECVVTDSDNRLSFLLTVNIKTATFNIEKPHVSVHPSPVVEGMNITFDCSVHYDIGVAIHLSWNYPSQIQKERIKLSNITTVDERNGTSLIRRKGLLTMTVFDITQEDEGNYTCHVVDHSRNEQESTLKLQVLNESTLQLSLRGQNLIKIHPGQKNVQLVVEIKSHPPPKIIQWYDYNASPIIEDQGSLYSIKTSKTESVLIIHDPEVHFSGTYYLFVDNDAQNKTINATLQVLGEPDLRVNGGNQEIFSIVGQQLQIDCDVFAFPRPNITWYFTPCNDYPNCSPHSELIPLDQYLEIDVNSLRGMIKSTVRVWINQTGEVTCKAHNSLGSRQEAITVLATDVEKGFVINYPASVVESDNVTLSCGASKFRYTKDLQWLYTDKHGHSSPVFDVLMWSEETDYSYFIKLNIPHVMRNHTGNYSCVANVRFGRGETSRKDYMMVVQNLQKPVIFKNVNTSWVVESGRTLVFKCEVIGAPTPIVVWYKDGVKVSNSSKYELHNNSQKLMVHVGLEEDGTYVCDAVNKDGRDSLEFKITVTDKTNKLLFIICVYVLPMIVVFVAVIAVLYARRSKKLRKEVKELKEAGLLHFEEGNIECLNPELDVGEQADLLPYDRKKWEFPRDKLKLGKPLGSGAFGFVVKAEAYELMEEGVATTVAVKMVKRNSDLATIKALASELKIMIHLGKHLNVVNVLGACTGDLNKRELLVLVEYCQYGNLHTYLYKHRGAFINQVNPKTGNFDPTVIQPTSPTSPSARFSDAFSNSDMYRFANGRASMRDSAVVSAATDTTLVMSDMSEQARPGANVSVETTPIGEDGYVISRDHEWRNKDRGDYKDNGLRPVCTQDLICWSFQIARGMEYLASRKVLHGDLAARNVLLADDNIVKICDFGFSKSLYNDCYQKKGEGPLPVKWMALESILDKVFSTQSDVWAYGITLWELFSLARTPYPGMDVVEKLIANLQHGYRMEQPKYATKQVYNVMLDCWHVNPNTRPSFTELAERLGGMLEDTVRTHYVDLNDPFLQDNSEFLAQQDYLSMLRSPSYANWSPPSQGYSIMKPIDEAMELTPMLGDNANKSVDHDSPDGSPITKPIGNNYVNVTQVMGFSNPSYHNLGRPKQSPYINMPDSSDEG